MGLQSSNNVEEHSRTPGYKEFTKSQQIKYICESRDAGATTSQAKWRITRQLTIGQETTLDYVNGDPDKWNSIADDRESLFPAPALDNLESLVCDGINDEVDFGNTFLYDIANQYSIGVWLKPDNLSAGRNIWAKSTPDANVYGPNLRHNATTGALFLQLRTPNENRQHTFDTALTAGVWQFLVYTFSGNSNINGARVYRNAVVGNTPASGTLTASWLQGQAFTLASRNGAFHFSGKMDQFTFWNKALSQTEINTLYNGGIPVRPDTLSFSDSLVTWCPMGIQEGDSNTTLIDNKGSNNGILTNFGATPFDTEDAA